MSKFELPEQLPATVAELNALADKATLEINVFQSRAAAGEELSTDDVARLEYLLDSRDAVTTARDEAQTAESDHADRLAAALGRATPAAPAEPEAPADPESPAEGDPATEVIAEAEAVVAEAAESGQPVAAANTKPVTFAGHTTSSTDIPNPDADKGWEMLASAPGYLEGKWTGRVGFDAVADSLLSINPGSRAGVTPTGTRGGKFATQAIARLSRDLVVPQTAQELRNEILKATSQLRDGGKVTASGLTAAGGWQAPSEQLYDFCNVPDAVDLLSLPEIGLPRGGLRWPNEPDVSALLTDFAFQWFFSEPELEAVDGSGDPTAVKDFIEIPAVDDFTEIRLSAIGYAVKGGILQNQAWPELTQWFLQTFAAAHLRGISWRSIQDMVTGSDLKVIPTDAVIGATSGVLNSLAINAVNLRLQRGYARNYPIEGVAPSWFLEVLRADLAMREGTDVFAVTDAQITEWLTARNIALQYVADWQSRGEGQPGHLDTQQWPGFVDVLLYPAGTWFRAMNPVIQMGIMYPLQQLQLNQMSQLFTEDGIAVAKRCEHSLDVRLPLCVNGAVGARESITCSYVGAETLSSTLTVTGTGGTYTLTVDGKVTSALAFNANAAAIKAALVALDDGYDASDFTVTGTGPYTIVSPAELGVLSVQTGSLTGGSATVA